MKHRILNTQVSPVATVFTLQCNCGFVWLHNVDEPITVCPKCSGRDSVERTKIRFATIHPGVTMEGLENG